MPDEKRKCKYQHPVQSAHYILRPVIQKSVSFAGIDRQWDSFFSGAIRSVSFSVSMAIMNGPLSNLPRSKNRVYTLKTLWKIWMSLSSLNCCWSGSLCSAGRKEGRREWEKEWRERINSPGSSSLSQVNDGAHGHTNMCPYLLDLMQTLATQTMLFVKEMYRNGEIWPNYMLFKALNL